MADIVAKILVYIDVIFYYLMCFSVFIWWCYIFVCIYIYINSNIYKIYCLFSFIYKILLYIPFRSITEHWLIFILVIGLVLSDLYTPIESVAVIHQWLPQKYEIAKHNATNMLYVDNWIKLRFSYLRHRKLSRLWLSCFGPLVLSLRTF